MVVLLDHATTQLRREGFGGAPRAEAGKLNLDSDPRVVPWAVWMRDGSSRARKGEPCLGLINSSGQRFDNDRSGQLHAHRQPLNDCTQRREPVTYSRGV